LTTNVLEKNFPSPPKLTKFYSVLKKSHPNRIFFSQITRCLPKFCVRSSPLPSPRKTNSGRGDFCHSENISKISRQILFFLPQKTRKNIAKILAYFSVQKFPYKNRENII